MNFINKMPIAAAVLGLALVFSQSAFKSNLATKLYANVGGSGSSTVWIEITGTPYDGRAFPASNTYKCLNSTFQLCTVNLDENAPAPTNGSSPLNSRLGTYIYQN